MPNVRNQASSMQCLQEEAIVGIFAASRYRCVPMVVNYNRHAAEWNLRRILQGLGVCSMAVTTVGIAIATLWPVDLKTERWQSPVECT